MLGLAQGLAQDLVLGASAGVGTGVLPGKMEHIRAISHDSLLFRGDGSTREATERMFIAFT